MKLLISSLLICLVAMSSLAQTGGTVTGTYSEGVPMINVEIKLYNDTRSLSTRTVSVAAGAVYRFENVPPGTYTIEARQGQFKQTVVVEAGTVVNLDIDTSNGPTGPSVVRGPLAQVTVIAAGKPQTTEAVSKTVDVVDAQEMRDRADFSLTETLRTIPGFRVQQLGGFGRTANIKTRGLRNQDTAFLIDGIRFRDPTAITGDASPFLSDFTLTSVDRIEVLRGSGSSLYGTNAIGGVIDLQTPTARQGTHGQIGGAFGGLGLGRFRGNVSHGSDNGKYGIGAGLSRTVYTKGIDGDDDAHNTNFQARFDGDPTTRTNISGRVFFSDANVRLNINPDTFGTLPPSTTTIIDAVPNLNFAADADDPDNMQRARFFSGQFSATRIITGQLVLSGYYQGLKTHRNNTDGPLGPGFQSASTSIFDGQIHTANAHLNWVPNPANSLTAGYEFEKEKFGNDGRTPAGTDDFFTRAGQRSNTFYGQYLVSLVDGSLQLAGGFRAQRYNLQLPRFSLTNAPYEDLTLTSPPTALTFDGAASYFARRSGTKLRAHVGNGYRVPSLYERFGTFFSTFGMPSFIALGDPFLKPERTVAFDAGVEQNAARERVHVSATYFYTRLTDIIGFGNVVPPIGRTERPFGGYENQKGGLARGAEFSVKARATDRTDIFASYTFTNSDQRSPQVSGSGVIRTLGVPDHQFTLVATQRFDRFWINFDLLTTSTYLAPIFSNSTFNTYIYRFKGNRKGDLTVGHTFGFKNDGRTLRIYGTVENMFNQEYYENGFRAAKATARFAATFGF